jgi:hypothetical protein
MARQLRTLGFCGRGFLQAAMMFLGVIPSAARNLLVFWIFGEKQIPQANTALGMTN